ncbi:MAG: hypothetical protein ABJD07_07800 [Gemmatimonadaceae bacterium]
MDFGQTRSIATANRQHTATTEALVRWDLITEVGEAFAVTADGPAAVVLAKLRTLLDSLTAPHRLLESLEADASAVLAGDSLAAKRLTERLDVLGRSIPALMGSRARAKALAEHVDNADPADRVESSKDHSTLSFDGLVRVCAAATVAAAARSSSSLHAALDVVLGLALRASAADRLLRGLTSGGPAGAAQALNDLRLIGHPSVAPPEMHTLSGGFGGLPGGPPGPPGGPRGPTGGGVLGGPLGPNDVPDSMGSLVAGLRDQHRWDPEIHDSLPTWREIVGLAPIEGIDRGEIYRVRCMIALTEALTLRQEPPPPRPRRVVWSDTISSVTASGVCAGDRIVIHGSGFGPPNAEFGVVLPVGSGCKAFSVPAADWTDTAITVTLPTGIASGTVGLVDIAYTRAYDAWATRMNELTSAIIENAKCAHAKAPDVQYVPLFNECGPLTPFNHLRAGLPVIRSFKVNGVSLAFVEPGQPVRLSWDFSNVLSFRLTRLSNRGPRFRGADFVDDPRDFDYDLGPFSEKQPTETQYELRAVGPCGALSVVVTVRLRKVPILSIEGVEITQAVQSFRDPNSPPNSIPLVAHKDTIVRVYVSCENLGDFMSVGPPGKVAVSGEVRLLGAALPLALPPLNAGSFQAQPRAATKRLLTDDTLNFRIPAAVASNEMYASMLVTVWASDEVESPPSGLKVRATAGYIVPQIIWNKKAPYTVRYVRISTTTNPAPSDAEAREIVVRGFDLLATPATDIQPARLATWNTSIDITDRDGVEHLLGQIDDQHNCTLSERIPFFDDDCPDDDGAVWIGVVLATGGPVQGIATRAQIHSASRNTCISDPSKLVVAHELGHTLKLNHVNPSQNCGYAQDADDDFDSLPNDGLVDANDPFDPHTGKVVPTINPLYDVMSYSCERWISRTNWRRVFDKF